MKPPLRSLPVGTLTWIGRLSIKSFHAELTDTFGEINHIPKAFHSSVTTIIVGHLVIQTVTMHALPQFATMHPRPICKPGAWDVNLLEIWPAFGDNRWPPQFTFTLDRSVHHIGGQRSLVKIGPSQHESLDVTRATSKARARRVSRGRLLATENETGRDKPAHRSLGAASSSPRLEHDSLMACLTAVVPFDAAGRRSEDQSEDHPRKSRS